VKTGELKSAVTLQILLPGKDVYVDLKENGIKASTFKNL